LSALGLKIHTSVDDSLAIGVVNIGQLDDALPAALRFRELKIDVAPILDRRLDFFHALDLLQFALRLGRFGVLGAEAVDKLHQAGDFAFLVFESGKELLFVRFALLQVIVIAAAITNEPALADFDDAADELVEELTVVGDDQDGPWVVL